MAWWLVLIMIGASMAVMAVLICFVCYLYTFFNFHKQSDPYALLKGEQYRKIREKSHKLISQMEGHPFEEVLIKAKDGIGLYGRYYHLADGAPLQIQVHGYRGNALRDFCGGNQLAREMGHNTLVVDQRAHGNSGGRTIGFGEKECEDVAAWVEYAAHRFGTEMPIILSGVSMGAATVLLCADMEMKGNVVGIIADCPYSSTQKIIRKVARDMGLPADILMPFIKGGARLFGGLSLDRDICAAAANSKVPILLIHGESDRFVPCQMSREIAATAEQVTLVTFAEAGHGLSYMTDYERYKSEIYSFVERVVPTK